ncbi:MAG: peptidoglycan-binding domain-containing protein [Polyangiales bacterium]
MITPGGWHTVGQGESVESVAYRAGHRWQTVWEHPSNTPLRELRRSPHVLLPGDRVFVPPLERKAVDADTTRRHRFRCENVPSRLRLRFSIGGAARANAPYVLTVDGVRSEGSTDGDGRIDVPVHPLAGRAVLEFLDEPGRTARRVFDLNLRHLDPSAEASGARSRLRHNGYDARNDDRARDALRSFQERNGLPPTGELDAATQDALSSSAEG